MFHDEVEIEDMIWNEEKKKYFYPCPCGDLFKRFTEWRGCSSLSLIIRVIYVPGDFVQDE